MQRAIYCSASSAFASHPRTPFKWLYIRVQFSHRAEVQDPPPVRSPLSRATPHGSVCTVHPQHTDLYTFNTTTWKLTGPVWPAQQPQANIHPDAFDGTHPAQVRVQVIQPVPTTILQNDVFFGAVPSIDVAALNHALGIKAKDEVGIMTIDQIDTCALGIRAKNEVGNTRDYDNRPNRHNVMCDIVRWVSGPMMKVPRQVRCQNG